MKTFIYADNAATTQLDNAALEAMIPWLTENYGNASQPYFFGKKSSKALKEARAVIAACINADPEEILFTSGGSESDNWAISCFGTSPADPLDIYTSCIEHHAILNACNRVRESLRGSVCVLPVSSSGKISPSVLSAQLQANKAAPSNGKRLVSIMFANNEIGSIQPIRELAQIAHQNGAHFHTDAVQAVGHVHIDVKELGVDMLSASAHKFNGPKGIGFLYVNKRTPIYSFITGGAQEFGMRAGTENVASIIGMATALKKNTDDIEANSNKLFGLENMLLKNLSGLDFIRNGSLNHIPGNISLSFRGADGEALLHRMDLKGICISTGSACDSVNTQLSHVIKAINVPEQYAGGTIRISLGKNNTEAEVIDIAKALQQILNDEVQA